MAPGPEKPARRRKTQHTKLALGQKLTFVRQLEPQDVLLGRGNVTNEQPGNKIFREFIRRTLRRFEEADTSQAKNDIAISTIRAIRKLKGRFVRRLNKDEAEQVEGWNGRTPLHLLIEEEVLVLDKTKQCYRHCVRKKKYLDDGGEEPEDVLDEDDAVQLDNSGGFGEAHGFLDSTPEEKENLVVSTITKEAKKEEVPEEVETRASTPEPEPEPEPEGHRTPEVSQTPNSGRSSQPALHQLPHEHVHPPSLYPVIPSRAALLASARPPHPHLAFLDASSLQAAHAHAAIYRPHYGAPYFTYHHRLATSPFLAHPPPSPPPRYTPAPAHLPVPSAPTSAPPFPDPESVFRPPPTTSNGGRPPKRSRRQEMIVQAMELLRAAAAEDD